MSDVKIPVWFWIVAVIALLWNLMGVMAFFMDPMITGSYDGLTETQTQQYQDRPLYAFIAFAVAVFSAALACIGLLLRKAWATLLFVVSFVAVIVQQAYMVLEGIFAALSGAAFVMPIMIPIIAAVLLWLSIKAKAKGWIH